MGFVKTALVGVASLGLAQAAWAGCGSSSTTCSSSSYTTSSHSSGYYGISEAYTLDTDVSHSATISSHTIPGLGANERLCPTSCGSSGVQGHGKVLACYAVCKPAPKPVTTTVLTRVVHPVYYVHYPVCPTCPPAASYTYSHASRYGGYGSHGTTCGGPRVKYSRYGSYGYGCR